MSGKIDKRKVLQALKEKLQHQLKVVTESAQSAHGAAVHEESKAEDKYDTRGLEASYLAGAQSKRALELEQQITRLAQLSVLDFSASQPIGTTALVTVSAEAGEETYLLMPFAGGVCVEVNGIDIRCITPQSPLGAVLMGKAPGDEVELRVGGKTRDLEITSVQ